MKVRLNSEEKTDAQRVAAFLHQLADRLLEGENPLKQGDKEVVTGIPGSLGWILRTSNQVDALKAQLHSLKEKVDSA